MPDLLDGIRLVDELELENQRVFIRVDFNVPLDRKTGEITDDERIRATLRTVQHVADRGAKVILASHLGRPKGQVVPELSLEPAGARVADLTGWEVHLPDDCLGDAAKRVISDLRPGQVCLLENLRFHPEEEKNDEDFARQLASLCDVYVGEAFGAAHRAHASVDQLPRMMNERAIGYLMRDEIAALQKITLDPEHPFVAVLGGAKVTDKVGVIEMLMDRCDVLCIGGAMANTLLAARGVDMRASRVEKDILAGSRTLLEKAEQKGVKVLLPIDVVVADGLDATEGEVVPVGKIPQGKMALDVGPETVAAFGNHLGDAKMIFWNGPMGLFENRPFAEGTLGVAQAIGRASAFSVLGGGDSAAAVHRFGRDLMKAFDFISTGGGAALELIEGKKLPGIESLRIPS